jgi:hypothetical protein
MFIVERVLKRGFFRDKVVMTATENASLSRKRLGWDLLQAPDLQFENLEVAKGQQLVVSLTKNRVAEGQSISVAEVTRSTAFNRFWKRAAG